MGKEMGVTEPQKVIIKLLFSILFCRTSNPDKLTKTTGINRDLCRLYCKRLRENGIIASRGVLRVDWFEEDHPEMCLLMDILVAEGTILRGTDDEGKLQWMAPSKEERTPREDIPPLPSDTR